MTYTYHAFGTLRSQGSTLSTSFLFTGEQFDAKARAVPGGLYYLRARYYDPTIGRFLTRDPLPGSTLSPQSLNPYPYVQNNPVNRVDPTGMLTEGPVCDYGLLTAALLIGLLGFAFIALPGAYLLFTPGAALGAVVLLELAGTAIELPALGLLLASHCVDE